MITLEASELTFRFPEVHEKAACSISFQRTLRIPDDEDFYPTPPGFGGFPLRHVDDYERRLPDEWLRRGGLMLPMYQAEALWLGFKGKYPFAVKVATGKICAVSGRKWVQSLNRRPQDYVALPLQPWLDGYCVDKGMIRQFVAMPLGDGYSVEEQLTGAAEHGGLQIMAWPMKREVYELYEQKRRDRRKLLEVRDSAAMSADSAPAPAMLRQPRHTRKMSPRYRPRPEQSGLAPGGRMRQKIHYDRYGLDAWDQRHSSRCFVGIVNSRQWQAVTGEPPPAKPPTALDYAHEGLPWFDFYGELEPLEATETLKGVSSVAATGEKKGDAPLPENDSIAVDNVIELGASRPARADSRVREMP